MPPNQPILRLRKEADEAGHKLDEPTIGCLMKCQLHWSFVEGNLVTRSRHGHEDIQFHDRQEQAGPPVKAHLNDLHDTQQEVRALYAAVKPPCRSMKVGYVLVPAKKQNLDLQVSTLTESVCAQIMLDQVQRCERLDRPPVSFPAQITHSKSAAPTNRKTGSGMAEILGMCSSTSMRAVALESPESRVNT